MNVKFLLDKLKSLDAYPKPLEDFRIKTFGGGLVAILSAVLVIVLVVSELVSFMAAEVDEELVVDTTRGEKLRINIDVVFHKIGCKYISVDLMDTSGEIQVDVQRNVFKRRLDLSGQPLEDPQRDEGSVHRKTRDNSSSTTTPAAAAASSSDGPVCGSCYGAESESIKCCNTCSDVRNAYRKRNWAMPSPSGITQCQSISVDEQHLNALNEGCQVYGFLEVSRVGGNFHMSPGRSYQMGHMHIHDIQPFSVDEFDLSHVIRHLSFGHNVPGKTNPLDGLSSTHEKGVSSVKYFVKIVPTMWCKADGAILSTNQFSATRYVQSRGDESALNASPGLFLVYEFAPVMVKYSEKQKSVLHLLTTLCSIIGGVVTVASLLDAAIFHSARAIRRKIDLGKQG